MARTEAIVTGDPFDPNTMMGAQVSMVQHDRIMEYINIGKAEGAKVLTGGSANDINTGGHYIKPTILGGTNDMRVFQEEIFGPVTSATTFKTQEEVRQLQQYFCTISHAVLSSTPPHTGAAWHALLRAPCLLGADWCLRSDVVPDSRLQAIAIANDTEFGLGAGVWTRDMHQAYQVPRAIQAGRVWVNCYHAYPAHAPFGGYKKSGFGRETHKMMLNSYRQTKNMLISYDQNKLGFF